MLLYGHPKLKNNLHVCIRELWGRDFKNTPRTPPQEEVYFEKCSQEHASDAVNNKILLV